MKRSSLVLVAIALLVIGGAPLPSRGQSQDQAPLPARSRAEETLQAWNDIGNKLVAMAADFPEDKYDFKLQKDQRTFAQNLLHIAAVDYDLMRSASGSNIGPEFGKNKHNPSQEVYKTKADVVKLIQQAVADGAKLIEQQGDAGLDKTTKLSWANKLVHNSYTWTYAIEHSAEHYGQLVVYYRANNLVPPDSRRHAQQLQPLPEAGAVDPKASAGALLKASHFCRGRRGASCAIVGAASANDRFHRGSPDFHHRKTDYGSRRSHAGREIQLFPREPEHSWEQLQWRAHICRGGQTRRRFQLFSLVDNYRRSDPGKFQGRERSGELED